MQSSGTATAYLDRGSVALELDNLSYKQLMSDTDELVHGSTLHVIRNDQRSGHTEDIAIVTLHNTVLNHNTSHASQQDQTVVVMKRGMPNPRRVACCKEAVERSVV